MRGKYDEAPSEAEIAEAKRQRDEVKAKWTNPDGTMKKGYHLAPNGKPSRLTEEQWITVRTPNFKRWFGDWETLAEAYPEHKIFDIDEAYKFARENLQGKEFTSKDGHAATLGRNGIDKMNSGFRRRPEDARRKIPQDACKCAYRRYERACLRQRTRRHRQED